MQKTHAVQKMTTAALLIAIGIIIPMFSPARIVLEPASFTLASHVPIFLSIFISPLVGVAVAAGTTLGFFFGGFPPVVVLRAASHLLFTLVGAVILQKRPQILQSPIKAQVFSLLIGLLHALGELVVVSAFYLGGGMGPAYYAQGFLLSVLLLVGVGTVVHSMVDFALAYFIARVLARQQSLASFFPAFRRVTSD